MTRMRPGMLIMVGSMVMSFVMAQAQQEGGTTHPSPSLSQQEAALAACGGGPVQGGRDVQPTPQRDKCLEDHLNRNRPQATSPRQGRQNDRERSHPQDNNGG